MPVQAPLSRIRSLVVHKAGLGRSLRGCGVAGHLERPGGRRLRTAAGERAAAAQNQHASLETSGYRLTLLLNSSGSGCETRCELPCLWSCLTSMRPLSTSKLLPCGVRCQGLVVSRKGGTACDSADGISTLLFFDHRRLVARTWVTIPLRIFSPSSAVELRVAC